MCKEHDEMEMHCLRINIYFLVKGKLESGISSRASFEELPDDWSARFAEQEKISLKGR